MRTALGILFLFFVTNIFASTNYEETCVALKNIRLRMNVIASNTANVISTRVPEGGPYVRRQLICKGDNCQMKLDKKAPLLKYEPDHPDADQYGYVAYPNINLHEEMADMIKATRDYEDATATCMAKPSQPTQIE